MWALTATMECHQSCVSLILHKLSSRMTTEKWPSTNAVTKKLQTSFQTPECRNSGEWWNHPASVDSLLGAKLVKSCSARLTITFSITLLSLMCSAEVYLFVLFPILTVMECGRESLDMVLQQQLAEDVNFEHLPEKSPF